MSEKFTEKNTSGMNQYIVTPIIMSWATFKKKHNPTIYTVQDGTLGIIYKVEPTMLRAGFKKETLPTQSGDHCPSFGIDTDKGTFKKQLLNYISDNTTYKDCTLVVYHVWNQRDGSTKEMDIFRK